MATQFEIWLNYTQAMRQADRLEDQAGRLEEIGRNRVASVLQELAGAWQGDNSEAFRSRAFRLQTEIRDVASILKRVAAVIRQTARNTYDAEMKALELAQKRTY